MNSNNVSEALQQLGVNASQNVVIGPFSDAARGSRDLGKQRKEKRVITQSYYSAISSKYLANSSIFNWNPNLLIVRFQQTAFVFGILKSSFRLIDIINTTMF